MTTFAQLLQQDPIEIVGPEILRGFYYDQLPELAEYSDWMSGSQPMGELVTCHIFHRQAYDYRRGQMIFGVRYDDEWIMVCRNAGREYDDFADRFVFSFPRLRKMVRYLEDECLRVWELSDARNGVKREQETSLTAKVDFHFYNHDVRVPFDRSNP